MPVEVFIHGALCVAYSGQCLTSESHRRPQRQPRPVCPGLPASVRPDRRRRAKDLGDKAYLLSPQDLAAYDLVCRPGEPRRVQLQDRRPAQEPALRRRDDANLPRRDRRGRRPPAFCPRRASRNWTWRRAFPAASPTGSSTASITRITRPCPLPQEPRRADRPRRRQDAARRAGRDDRRLPLPRGPRGFAAGGELHPATASSSTKATPSRTNRAGGFPKLWCRLSSLPRFGRGDRDAHRHASISPTRSGRNGKRVEIIFDRGSVNLAAVAVGATVWKTDDPAVRRRLESSYSRDQVARRVPLSAAVIAARRRPAVRRGA